MKPRIFVSTVTSEFKTARTKIGHVLEFLGYEVEQQDIFGTEGGDLRQMLREKIDACDALIQLAGDGYGAEPPAFDPDFGRVSYTQFEFLYARLQGKKTYVLIPGAACQKDKPIAQLDLPWETAHPDPSAHQAELRDLQSAYRARLRSEGHLWHSPADDTALENSVLKLRNDSEQLRKEFKDWQKSLAKSQTRTSRNILLLAALVLLLGIGGYLAWQSTRTQLTELSQPKPLDKSRLREHLTAASEKALARDLAEAEAIKGDWEKRQKLTDAAQAAHQQRLSRVSELADEFATLDSGENASTTLSEMLRILEEENIDSALAYLSSQSTRLVAKAAAKSEAARQDLQPLLSGAQLAIANGQPEKAETLFQQILAPGLPDWPQARHEYIVYLIWTKGSRQQTHQTLAAALTTFREAERQSRLLNLQDPENTLWQSDLSASHNRLGDIAVAQGDLPAASKAYTASLEIAQALAAHDPQNTQWQRDFSVSHIKLGDIAVAQGDLPAAFKSFSAQMEIAKALAARDPENTEWQRDLSISHDRLGDIAVALGDVAVAAKFYSSGMEIRKALVARDPENTEWQRDLSISHIKLGDVAVAQGDLSAAADAYTARFEIIKALAARDPENKLWQRDLSVSHYHLGNIAEKQGDLPAAAKAYTAYFEITKSLVIRDPQNTELQRNLGLSHIYLGDIAMAQGDLPAAAKTYNAGMEITKALAARDPQNTQWQLDLGNNHERLGALAKAQGDLPAAADAYSAKFEIIKTLAARDPENTQWQRDLSSSHSQLGKIAVAQGDLAAAAEAYNADMEIAKSLAARDLENTEWQRDLSISHCQLADIAEKRGEDAEARQHYRQSHDILQAIADKGKPVSPEDMKWLAILKQKLGIE